MALDPNINRIKFLRSTTANAKPALADLQDGEIALNLTDRVLYSRNGNNIVDIGFGLGGAVKGDVSVTGAISATTISAPTFVGSLSGNSSTTTKLQTARTINTILFDGSSNISTPATEYIISVDIRNSSTPNYLKQQSAFINFTTLGSMNSGVSNGEYADMLSFNTWNDASGGQLNALVMSKTGNQKLLHYRGAFGSAAWNTPKEIAYTDSSITGNSATSSRPETARYVAMGGTTAWKRIATFTSGGYGHPLKINFVGGAGFNSLTSQMRNSSILIKQGNTNNSTSFEYVYDDTMINPFGEVILRNIGTNIWEIWALVTGYSTYYMWADFPNTTSYTHNWDSETTTKPTGTISTAAPTKINAFTSSNVASATKLETTRTIFGNNFDGTQNVQGAMSNVGAITLDQSSYPSVRFLPIGAGTNGFIMEAAPDGTPSIAVRPKATIGSGAGTIATYVFPSATMTGTRILATTDSNVASATKLQTARTINGVAFDGTANITIADSTKLPLSGGTLTGGLFGTAADFSGEVKIGFGIISEGPLDFYNTSSYGAQKINVGGVLVSNSYGDENLVPANGIYSRGIIQGNTGIAINNTNILGHGIGLYNGDCGNATNLPNYGMALGATSQYGLHGALTGQYAVYLTCSQTGNPRGWIFKSSTSGTANAASITNDGAFSANRGYYLTNNLNNNIRVGNGDGASYATHNLIIQSHWGIGFRSNTDTATLLMDTRSGNLSMAGTMASNVATCNTLNVGGSINNFDLDVLMYSPVAYAGTVPPTGWLAMMGQTITQAQYPKLFALYGDTLPDMRAMTIRGWDNGRGIDANRTILSYQNDAIKAHSHDIWFGTDPNNVRSPTIDSTITPAPQKVSAPTLSGVGQIQPTGDIETKVKNIAFNYIVKAG